MFDVFFVGRFVLGNNFSYKHSFIIPEQKPKWNRLLGYFNY